MKGALDDAGIRRSASWIGRRGIGFKVLAQHHLGPEAFVYAPAATVVGGVEAAEQPLKIPTPAERDAQHLALNPAVEVLDTPALRG